MLTFLVPAGRPAFEQLLVNYPRVIHGHYGHMANVAPLIWVVGKSLKGRRKAAEVDTVAFDPRFQGFHG